MKYNPVTGNKILLEGFLSRTLSFIGIAQDNQVRRERRRDGGDKDTLPSE